MNSSQPEIYVFIGTKAELIKMFPVMQELDRRQVAYKYIDTGQHSLITKRLRKMFGLREPDIFLGGQGRNITGILQALTWNISIILKGLLQSRKLFSRQGICLVIGDTNTTLLGLIAGRAAGMRIWHIEAGERTHNLLNPFPEEIIRVLVDRFAETLFASSDISQGNLQDEKVKGGIVNIGFNTLVDAIQVARNQENIEIDVPDRYVLVSIHRFETIKSRARLKTITQAVQKAADRFEVVWGLHEPTRNQLVHYNLLVELEKNPRIHLRGLWDYFPFIKAINNSDFFITDGGGPQEESWFLGVPCMLMRTETERKLHENVFITEFDPDKIDYFIANYQQFKRAGMQGFPSPAKLVVDYITDKIA